MSQWKQCYYIKITSFVAEECTKVDGWPKSIDQWPFLADEILFPDVSAYK